MTIDKQEIKALADCVKTDRRFCADEYHHVLAEGVQALLSEIERLEHKNGNQAESIRQYRDHLEGDDSILSLTNERDQLKAENEALRDSANFRAIQSLRADCEALRKDAARWRFVRNAVSNRSPFAVWHEGSLPFLGSKADEAVDAAMAKEASRG